MVVTSMQSLGVKGLRWPIESTPRNLFQRKTMPELLNLVYWLETLLPYGTGEKGSDDNLIISAGF